MTKKQEAIQLFEEGFNCSQAVLGAFSKDLNLDQEMALKIATGFGGGSRNGELCGAVAGALMVLGLKEGHYIKGDTEGKQMAYQAVKEFTNRFREEQGSIVCKDLLGYDLSKPEEYQFLVEQGKFKTDCPKYISCAIELLENL
jgi:C_GCAxxG_C_C family probable redox protein